MKLLARAFCTLVRFDSAFLKTGLRFSLVLFAGLLFGGAGLSAQTNLGSVAVGSSASATVTLTLGASGTIVAPVVMTQGATGLDFTDAGTGTCTTNGTSYSYSSGATCTVVVNFSPLHPGTRMGGVQLLSSTGSVAATAAIYGIGVGPQITYSPNWSVLADFYYPTGIAFDGSGNVYVAATNDNAVKEILAVGGVIPSNPTIVTLGSGFKYPYGVAVDGSGNVYVTDQANNGVHEILAVGGVIPPNPTIRSFGNGIGAISIALDGSGNVYLAYSDVLEIEAVGGVIPSNPTVRTLGSGFSSAGGVAVDASGNVYVADTGNGAVKEMMAVGGVIPANPTIITLGSGFTDPVGVAVDASGNVYVGDDLPYKETLKEMMAVGGVIPSNPTIITLFNTLYSIAGVAVDGLGNVYFTDPDFNRVSELTYGSPTNVSFRATNVGSMDNIDGAYSVKLSNIGNANLDFTVPTTGTNPSIASGFAYDAASTCPQLNAASSQYSLAPSTSCTYAIDFIPTARGSNSGSLILTDNDPIPASTQAVPLSGIGIQPIWTSSTTLTSSATNIHPGQAVLLTATVTGTGTPATGSVTFTLNQGTLGISYLNSGNGITNWYGLIGTGTYVVTATYSGDFNYSGSTSNTFNIISEPLTGTIQFNWPYLNWAQPVAYGASSTPWPVTLSNGTGATISAPVVSITGANAANFQISGSTCNTTIPMNNSCTFGVNFAPTMGGSANGTLTTATLTATSSGHTTSIVVKGVAQVSTLSFNWPFLNFTPTVSVGSTSQAWPVTMTNQSGTSTTVNSINFSDASFTLSNDNCTGQTLAAGAGCTFSVLFSPILADITQGGTNIISGTMTASGNSGAVTGTLTVGGWGGAGGLAINWNQDQQAGVSTIDFGPNNTQNVTSGPWPITVYNNMATTETLTLSPSLGVFTTGQSNCTNVLPGSGCLFNLYFTPTAVQTYQGTLTITGSTGGSYTFNTWGQAIR